MIQLQKIQILLQDLDQSARKRLGDFVQSPYFNQNPRLWPLLQLLYRHIDQAETLQLSAEKLYQTLYPADEPFKMQRIYDHLSFLTRLVERFFAMEQLNEAPLAERLLQLEYLAEHDLWSLHQRIQKKSVPLQAKQKLKNSESHLQHFLLLKQLNFGFLALGERRFDEYLNRMDKELTVFFLAQKLKNACEMLNRGNVIQGEYHATLLPEILTFVAGEEEYLTYPSVALYYQLYLCLSLADIEGPFQQFRALLQQEVAAFDQTELSGLYDYAQNICVKQINSGNSEYLQVYFELFQEMLTLGLMLEEGMLDHRLYKNIVTVGLRLSEFDWVEDFLHSYAERLSPAFREAAYHYNFAAYCHARKDYRQAQRNLWKVELEDVYYQLGKRTLLLKIYYELAEEDGLDAQIRAFRAYLKRNRKVSSYQQKAHAGLIRYTQRLSRLRNKKESLSLKQFRHAIGTIEADVKNRSLITNRDWLLQQMKELA
ncbi:MAG: hypothetical protein AAF927_22605 [Bacteroidota bacterium]